MTSVNRGFSAPIVQALGGWKTERMMKRYAAVTDQTLRAAAEAVSGADNPLPNSSGKIHPTDTKASCKLAAGQELRFGPCVAH
jgi:hypothetical protein